MRTRILLFSAVSAFLSACAPRPFSIPMSFNEFKAFEAASEQSSTPASDCTAAPLAQFRGQSCQDLRQEFRFVVYVGKQIYCYWDEKSKETGTDYDALAVSLEKKITDQSTYSQYYTDVLQTWAATLHDGHVNPMPGEDMSRLEVLQSGVRLRLLSAATDHERLIVSSSQNLQIPVGSQILKINGTEVHDLIDTAVSRQSGSTARMRRFFAARKLLDVIGVERGFEPTAVEIKLPNGTTKTVQIARKLELSLPPQGSSAETRTTGEELVQAQILPGKIAYLKIDGFMGSRMGEIFDRKMKQLKGAAGLILDVRNNGGGDQSGSRILRWLAKQKIVRYFASPRRADFLLAQRPDLFALPLDPTDNRFYNWAPIDVEPTSADEGSFAGKPVAVLTSPFCFSACDTFVAGIQANGLGYVVGEGTGGGTGSPMVFDLPVSELAFRYSVVRGQTAKRELLEGVGTLPDLTVEYTESDLGKDSTSDSQATKAIEYILSRLTPAPVPAPAAPGSTETAPATQEQQSARSATMDEFIRLKLESLYRE